ncbi:MMS19 nucleotide excision repair protein [Kluyveromyces marxianus]|uniref:MMS19 nucleotide excision repair protein n=1 Tax=Kluyveromyces marxianus (strain DMKU3-1042 / BCC 29191 / NBRC 104275) TaxID=1003335 RepID=W0TFL3_KLUMD|nr:DNA repair/transcription protein MET18/MMS19 [Kluyveromyces marxianus DMKU3-1042]BAO41828.1 DNA repair/transcription protein MET18/MMS19 [Kluyveromyces marxianus DMKU3-1042]BAP73263.1 DNA repair/transcription protein MET18/MMS19 [Kluyveromyces marxianus]
MSGHYSEDDLKAEIVSFMANIKVNTSKADKLAKKIANQVTNENVELLRIVLLLRDYLTSEDNTIRQNALCCLSSILAAVSPSVLKNNDVTVIFDFYQSKMEDSGCMKETLQGINSLVLMECFYSSHVRKLLDILANDYQPTNFLAATRYFGFNIMDNILAKFKAQMLENDELNDKFIETFIRVATGEKDPRNLLISFRLNKEITTGLNNIDKFKEELFDILFCYFPIMFRPPSNDPYKITNGDLKLALRNAISATEKFEEDAFGNLLDKLTASSPSVKNDTIMTIKACLDNFSGTSSLKHWLPIWDALKFEIMNGTDPEPSLLDVGGAIENSSSKQEESFNNYASSLSVITSLSLKLILLDEHAFDKFFMHIFDEIIPNFKQNKDLKQCCDLLASISKVNLLTFNKVIKKIFPVLFMEKDLDVTKQKLLLLNLAPFFDAYISVSTLVGEEVSQFSVKNELRVYKDDVVMLLSKCLTGTSKSEVTLRTLSIVHFTTLVKMDGFLDAEEIAMVVQYFTETILTDDNKNIYCACLEGLKFIGSINDAVVYDVSLKYMLDLLPIDEDSKHLTVIGTETVPPERILKVILDFTTSRHHLVKESIVALSIKLKNIVKNPTNSNYCFLVLSCLDSLLQNNVENFEEGTGSYLKAAIEKIIIDCALDKDVIYLDDHSLTLSAHILFYLNLKADIHTHQDILNFYYERFVEHEKIFESPKRSIVVYSRVLSALDKSLLPSSVNAIFRKTINLLESDENMSALESLGYLEFLALLSNKWLTEKFIDDTLDLQNISMKNLQIIFWVNKGLVMKNSASAIALTDYLFGLLGNEQIGNKVAQLFEILVLDLPIFEKFKKVSWNNNVRLLYKQKFFNHIATKMVESFKAAKVMTIKSNYLTGLSLVLKNTPSTITISYIKDLLPLLLQALQLENGEVRLSSLQTLNDTVEKNPQLITEHVHTLVPLLLGLISPSKYNNASVRLLSLEVLQKFPENVPLNYLIPLKSDIIMKLQIGLDDKKRKVRKQCIDTKQTYIELGQVPFE